MRKMSLEHVKKHIFHHSPGFSSSLCSFIFFTGRVCLCVHICVRSGLYAVYLAVEFSGVYTGFDYVEQRVNQTLTSAHLFSGFLSG